MNRETKAPAKSKYPSTQVAQVHSPLDNLKKRETGEYYDCGT